VTLCYFLKRTDIVYLCLLFIITVVPAKTVSVNENPGNAVRNAWREQYNTLEKELGSLTSFDNRLVQDKNAGLLPSDRDPLDVMLRRTQALLDNIKNNPVAPDVSALQARLDAIREQARRRSAGSPSPRGLAKSTAASAASSTADFFMEAAAVRRAAMFANPLLNFDSLLFIERGTLAASYHDEINGDHLCDEYFGHNGKAGGGLYILKGPFGTSPQKIDLLKNSTVQKGPMAGASLSGGSFCSPDLSFDGTKIAFAWSPGGGVKWAMQNRFRIFVVNIDGSNLVQLTGDVNEDDFDPCWLPGDKRIVFISTRRGGYGRCHGRPVPTYTMFSMKSDGTDLFCIDWHETNEFHPSINNDGKIVYTRWDYVDRDAVITHHFWLCNPDGRDPRSYHGNYPLPFNTIDTYTGPKGLELRPMSEFNIRSIPGTSDKYIATAGPHHGQAFGDLVLLDITVPDNGMAAQVKKITSGPLFRDNTGDYGTPWPLSETCFLCNYLTGLYVIDNLGNRELIYKCTANQPADTTMVPAFFRPLDPMPVRPKKRIDGSDFPAISTQTYQGERALLADHKPATISIINVTVSDLTLPAGDSVKWLRIVQLCAKATPNTDDPKTGYGTQSLVRVPLGIVPVESDGSVYCEAPVGKPLYFQLLNAKGLAVHSMRSDTYVHAGENLSCVGCHEDKWKATPVTGTPLALRRAPSKISPEVIDGAIPFNWYRLVKPVLDANCTQCHLAKNQAPDMSYASLETYAFCFQGAQGNFLNPIVGGSRTTPGKFGAQYAKLTKYLDSTHYGVKLSDKDRRRITLWLDLNSNELGAYTNLQQQRAGAIVWPELDIDPANPLGVEDPSTTTNKPATVIISPSPVIVKPGQTVQFTAIAIDSLCRRVIPQPVFTWSVSGGTIDQNSGVFKADTVEGGPFTVSVRAVIDGTTRTYTTTVLVTSLGGLQLSPGFIKRWLCLQKAGSTCILPADTASIINKYTGAGRTVPAPGTLVQVNGSGYTWKDQTGSGTWFADCKDTSTSFSYITIVNPKLRSFRFGYIQDDQITVWMNGIRLFSDKNWTDTARLSPLFTMQRGNVEFFFKHTNVGGSGKLLIRLADSVGKDIPELLYFTDPSQTPLWPDGKIRSIAAKPVLVRLTSGNITINGSCLKSHRLEIFNAAGRRLLMREGGRRLSYFVPASRLPAGLLILRTTLDGKLFVQPILNSK
jgi:hypothetical protein